MKNPELTIYYRRLPHWRLEGQVYFVTWRLHVTQKTLTSKERNLVRSALSHFEGERYSLFAYVVMDDHVHVLFSPLEGNELKSIIHSWKSFTGHRLCREFGRPSPVWQDESFDRIVRNEAEFLEKGNYILSNPRKRWPDMEDYPWVGLGKSWISGQAGPVPAKVGNDCPTK